MNYLPPEYTTLASFVIPLEEFLEGEFEFENVYMHGDVDSGTKSPTSSAASDKKVIKIDFENINIHFYTPGACSKCPVLLSKKLSVNFDHRI